MSEQGFNYTDSTVKEMTDYFETRVENLEPKEDKKKSSPAAKKSNDKTFTKTRKQEDYDSIVVESSEDFSVEHGPIKKYCILYGKCSHSPDKCNDLHTMASKQAQEKKMNLKSYGKNNKELNALIEKKIRKFINS